MLGILPTFGLYAIVSYAADDPLVWLFWVGIAAFAAMLYPKAEWPERVGASLFYLAIEAFLLPIAVLVVTVGLVSETAGPFARIGAGIGAGVVFLAAWFVSWMVGVVLYLVSGRFESD